MLVEVLSESALIAKAEAASDFSDSGIVALESFARGLDAEFHDEGLRAAAEGFNELPMKLPGERWTRAELRPR